MSATDAPVGVVERAGDFPRDADRVFHGQLLLAGEAVAQRLPLHERHDVVEEAASVSRVDEAADVTRAGRASMPKSAFTRSYHASSSSAPQLTQSSSLMASG
jgi:hypothetical protein